MCQNVAGTYSDTAGTRRIPEQKLASSIKGRKKVNIFAEEILLSNFCLKFCEKLACGVLALHLDLQQSLSSELRCSWPQNRFPGSRGNSLKIMLNIP